MGCRSVGGLQQCWWGGVPLEQGRVAAAAHLQLACLQACCVSLVLALNMLCAHAMQLSIEDAALAERYGDSWSSYKAKVKKLIPFVY